MKSYEVKDWQSLLEVLKSSAKDRFIWTISDNYDGTGPTVMAHVSFEGCRLSIQDNGCIDVTTDDGITSPILPDMYPVVVAAIAEIERQNA